MREWHTHKLKELSASRPTEEADTEQKDSMVHRLGVFPVGQQAGLLAPPSESKNVMIDLKAVPDVATSTKSLAAGNWMFRVGTSVTSRIEAPAPRSCLYGV